MPVNLTAAKTLARGLIFLLPLGFSSCLSLMHDESRSVGRSVDRPWADMGAPGHFIPVEAPGLSAVPCQRLALAMAPQGDAHALAYAATLSLDISGRIDVWRLRPDTARWESVGSGAISPAPAGLLGLVMGLDGRPFLVYTDMADPHAVAVLRLDQARREWQPVGRRGITTRHVVQMALALAPSGYPVVLVKDDSLEMKATVWYYDVNIQDWKTLGPAGFTDGEINYPAVDVAADGTVWVGYYDENHNGRATVHYHAPGDSAWHLAGPPGFTASRAIGLTLALDAQDRPHLAFTDGADLDFRATVLRGLAYPAVSQTTDTSVWRVLGKDGFTPGQALYPTLAFSPGGEAVVAFADDSDGDRAAVMRYDTASARWSLVGAPGLTANAAGYPALDFGSRGEPWVAFAEGDARTLAVMRWVSDKEPLPRRTVR